MVAFYAEASAQDLPAPDDLRLWLRADAGVVHDQNGRISVWQDQSGNGSNATQTNGGEQPFLAQNHLNGLPVVGFYGGQYFRLPNFMNGATAGEIFIIVESGGPGGWGMGEFCTGAFGSGYSCADGYIYNDFVSSDS